MSAFNLICMAFDGDYVTERRGFADVDQAWERSEDMGSRWYFYPFSFVTSTSGLTIVAAPLKLEFLKGKRVATVKAIFKRVSASPEAQGADVMQFTLLICKDQGAA